MIKLKRSIWVVLICTIIGISMPSVLYALTQSSQNILNWDFNEGNGNTASTSYAATDGSSVNVIAVLEGSTTWGEGVENQSWTAYTPGKTGVLFDGKSGEGVMFPNNIVGEDIPADKAGFIWLGMSIRSYGHNSVIFSGRSLTIPGKYMLFYLDSVGHIVLVWREAVNQTEQKIISRNVISLGWWHLFSMVHGYGHVVGFDADNIIFSLTGDVNTSQWFTDFFPEGASYKLGASDIPEYPGVFDGTFDNFIVSAKYDPLRSPPLTVPPFLQPLAPVIPVILSTSTQHSIATTTRIAASVPLNAGTSSSSRASTTAVAPVLSPRLTVLPPVLPPPVPISVALPLPPPLKTIKISDVAINYDPATREIGFGWKTNDPTNSFVRYQGSTSSSALPLYTTGDSLPGTLHSVSFSAFPGVPLIIQIDAHGTYGQEEVIKEYHFLPLASTNPSALYLLKAEHVPSMFHDMNVATTTTDSLAPQAPQAESLVKAKQQIDAPAITPVVTQVTSLSTQRQLTKNIPLVSEIFALLVMLLQMLEPLLVSVRVSSVQDLRFEILRTLGVLFARKRTKEPWGTVYDAESKQALDPVYVSLCSAETNTEVMSAITDLEGRYGFIASPGTYILRATKTHYGFPSKTLLGRKHDTIYDELYFGETFTISTASEIVMKNIPLDPIYDDWNEKRKHELGIGVSHKRKQVISRILNIVFMFGLLLSLLACVLAPTVLNISIAVLYLLTSVIKILWKRHFRLTTVVRRADGTPVPHALIEASYLGSLVLAKKVVSDDEGRFYLLLVPGDYKIVVSTKREDGVFVAIHTEDLIRAPKGILLKDIIV